MTESSQIRVWDPLVRFFHWSLVTAFFIAYFTEDDLLTVHSWAGYLIFTLLIIRLAWGFIGTRYARFSDFTYSPHNIIQFLKDTLHLRATRYLGHNPAGGAMVIMLLFSLLMTTTSGILLLGAEEQAGPVAHWFTQSAGFWGDVLEELHEFFANFTLLLVFVHVIGVLVESLIHKENLVSAMLTGFKPEQKIQTEDKI
ncbi:MAG: cytochrome b/b6 domain-containing protein [Gammaproteobacteria bacterium]|nr:cytochrome b/b6 domain-containing protein [Gammaproteobacteria bacterium]